MPQVAYFGGEDMASKKLASEALKSARRKAARKSILSAQLETVPIDPVYVQVKQFVLSFLGHNHTPPPVLTEYTLLNDPDFHFSEMLLSSLGEEFNLISRKASISWNGAQVRPSDLGAMYDAGKSVGDVIRFLYSAITAASKPKRGR